MPILATRSPSTAPSAAIRPLASSGAPIARKAKVNVIGPFPVTKLGKVLSARSVPPEEDRRAVLEELDASPETDRNRGEVARAFKNQNAIGCAPPHVVHGRT